MTFDLILLYTLNNLAGRSYLGDRIIVFLASYMAYVLIAVFLILLYTASYTRSEKFRMFGVAVISAVVARLGVTEIIRFFYHRPRPFVTLEIHQLIPESAWSFPSGHSAFFFAMATAIFLYNKKWGAGFFIAAIVMNVSRVIAGVHYPTDILGGIVVGILTACVVFLCNRKKIYSGIVILYAYGNVPRK